jgi:hypothetical protein
LKKITLPSTIQSIGNRAFDACSALEEIVFNGTKAEWETVNPILKEGEMGIEVPDTGVGTGLCKFKLGDGYNKWSDLPYSFDGTAASAIYGGTPSVSHDGKNNDISMDAYTPLIELKEGLPPLGYSILKNTKK